MNQADYEISSLVQKINLFKAVLALIESTETISKTLTYILVKDVLTKANYAQLVFEVCKEAHPIFYDDFLKKHGCYPTPTMLQDIDIKSDICSALNKQIILMNEKNKSIKGK